MLYSLPHPLFRPRTNHKCHQKPNPSRETVPLMLETSKEQLKVRMKRVKKVRGQIVVSEYERDGRRRPR
jgi:hypothetical protein